MSFSAEGSPHHHAPAGGVEISTVTDGDRLTEAQRLVDELDAVLSSYAVDSGSPVLIRLRLARAYVLGLRDELSRIDRPSSGPR